MDERQTPAGTTDISVQSEYFSTMRRFLETQARVMSAFLSRDDASGSALHVAGAPIASPRAARIAPATVIVAPAVPAAPAPIATPLTVLMPAAAANNDESRRLPEAVAANAATGAAPAALARAELVDLLLDIVEEKTGYPRDMVGLEQNLEADLGVDSIKRIEIVGALLQRLPERDRAALAESRSKLNTQPTLRGILDQIAHAGSAHAVATPFTSDAPSLAAVVGQPSRLVMQPRREAFGTNVARRLTPGRFVLTLDHLGVAEALAFALHARGTEVVIVGPDVLASETLLIERCQALRAESPIAGVVHLAALGSPAVSGLETPADWRQAIHVNEKSFFLLLREVNAHLLEGAHVVAATDLGGLFGRDGTANAGLRLQSGAVGGVKSFRAERPDLRVKAVDLDSRRSTAELASDLLGEIEVEGGRQEVGYPAGERTVFHSIAEAPTLDPLREAALANLVVLATGGARGITAEVLRELARPGNVLVLTGRSPLDARENAETATLMDVDALRKHYVGQVRAGLMKLTPGEIQRRVQAVLAQREMQSNLADLRNAGATVEYHAVDVTDEDGIRALVEDVTRRHGPITGVVHGAGVIEDKLLADKQSDSWSRVVDTKVIGLLLLQKFLDPAALKFFTVFSSVAGRYGNSGQSDYATANELMNRICIALDARWGGRVAVSALCWGPWGATTFGAGMVTADTEAKFAEQGVRLVSPSLGRRLFRQELARSAGAPVEVICGEAAWESREIELGVVRLTSPAPVPAGAPSEPLLGNSVERSLPTGERIVPVLLDPDRHLYLHEHVLDGKMVLPAAAALETMAEAARMLWPGWCVTEVLELKLLKGIELDGSARSLQVMVKPPPYGSSEGFEVSAALQSELGAGRALTHYRCVVRLEQSLAAATPAERRVHSERTLSVGKAYGEWLFHGPRFRVIEHIDGLSPAGSGARVRATHPPQWLANQASGSPDWVFDPALLDAAAQMAWLWSRAYRDESALPTRFGRVVRYRDHFPAHMHMEYERIETTDPTLIRGNVVFFDEQGEPVMAIEELDSVASAALNRFGGTAREANDAAA